MTGEYREKRRLLTSDTAADYKIKYSAILDIFQEAASRSAEALSAGYEDMRKKGMFWVLSRLKMRIQSRPVYLDEIEVRTWPKDTKGAFYTRDYEILFKGSPVISATSVWCALDAQTHRVIPSSRKNLMQGVELLPDCADCAPPQKIFHSENILSTYDRQVYPSDLDFNLHVNNCRYADYITDALEESDGEIRSLQIHFLKEVKAGERLAVEYRRAERGVTVIGRIGEDSAFEGEILYEV